MLKRIARAVGAFLLFLLGGGWFSFPSELSKAFLYDRLVKLMEPYLPEWSHYATEYFPVAAFFSVGFFLFYKAIKGPPPIFHNINIEITTASRSPYRVKDITGSRALSIVRIGLKNTGTSHLSNCNVYIDKISPPVDLAGGLPIRLNDSNFTLRTDDPQKLVDIAHHWEHVDKFRFYAPLTGGWGVGANYIDDKDKRTIVIKFTSTELQKSISCKLYTNDEKELNLEFIGETS